MCEREPSACLIESPQTFQLAPSWPVLSALLGHAPVTVGGMKHLVVGVLRGSSEARETWLPSGHMVTRPFPDSRYFLGPQGFAPGSHVLAFPSKASGIEKSSLQHGALAHPWTQQDPSHTS